MILSKVTIKNVGHAKKIKDAYPKKVCHMLNWHVKKKIKKDAYPKKACHMRWIMQRSSSTLHQKKSHTLAHLDQIV